MLHSRPKAFNPLPPAYAREKKRTIFFNPIFLITLFHYCNFSRHNPECYKSIYTAIALGFQICFIVLSKSALGIDEAVQAQG
jgi:hypothetical protein